MPTEADARIAIDRKLKEAGWILEGSGKNVLTEQHSGAGTSDYLLLDRNDRNDPCVYGSGKKYKKCCGCLGRDGHAGKCNDERRC